MVIDLNMAVKYMKKRLYLKAEVDPCILERISISEKNQIPRVVCIRNIKINCCHVSVKFSESISFLLLKFA